MFGWWCLPFIAYWSLSLIRIRNWDKEDLHVSSRRLIGVLMLPSKFWSHRRKKPKWFSNTENSGPKSVLWCTFRLIPPLSPLILNDWHVISQLEHPNIMSLKGFSLNPPTMVLELILHGDLSEFLNKKPHARMYSLSATWFSEWCCLTYLSIGLVTPIKDCKGYGPGVVLLTFFHSNCTNTSVEFLFTD